MSFRYTRPDNLPPIIKNLIIINVLFYIAQLTLESQFHLTQKLMLYPIKFEDFRPYQVFTHMFAHSPNNFFHIFFNMFSLWMFGRRLENLWGPGRFLFFYLACGIGAAACHMIVQYIRFDQVVQQTYEALERGDEETAVRIFRQIGPALGASGAVMGVMAGFAYLFPNTEFIGMFIPIPIKAKWLILALVAADLFGGFSNMSRDNVGHFAHLGGALTGFIIVLLWNKSNRKTFY